MRAAHATEQLAQHLLRLVNDGDIDQDVTQAFIADTDAFANAAKLLGRYTGTEEEFTQIVKDVAESIDDGLADWLTEHADSPGAWLYRQISDRLS